MSRELSSRLELLEGASGMLRSAVADTERAILSSLFDKQLAFHHDKARRKAAFCTRRAGKTDYTPKGRVLRAISRPESIRVYLAVTRVRAKELIWRPLQLLNERYMLGAEFNETLATVTFPNHAVIRLRGADDKREAQKGRGDKLDEVDIDEAQIFPSDILETMVEDVYGPSLEDTGGTLSVYGTPGIVCAGKWFEMTRPDAINREAGWSVHSWSVLDNPFMAHMKTRLPEIKAERKWADDNPTYLREWLGRWVNDNTALFYRFDPTRNVHHLKESAMLGGKWEHVLGWDIGLNDDMALTIWAYHPNERKLREAYSWKKNGITSDEVVDHVLTLEARGYNFVAKVADTGGLGALIVEEVKKRRGMRFEAAKKTDKAAHVELLNDELLTGRVELMAGSPYAQEMAVLPKDPDGDPLKPPVEDPRFPNHNCDAGLYAWRWAYHYLFEPEEEERARPGTDKWHEQHAKRLAEQEASMRESALDEQLTKQQERAEQEEWGMF